MCHLLCRCNPFIHRREDLEPAKHAAAQAVRQRLDCWPEELSPGLRQRAEFLAWQEREEMLALFLGTGIGVPAGLPN